MQPGPPRRRRARPVADASLDVLLDRSEDLAKGWLLALLEQTPLEDAPHILATDLTREGPRVCEAVLRAIGSDAGERRLKPNGPLAPLAARVGELAGAAGPRDAAQAVDALQAVMWAALRAEISDPDPELVSQLAERLAQVSAVLRAAVLCEPAASGVAAGEPADGGVAAGEPADGGVAAAEPAPGHRPGFREAGSPKLSTVPPPPADVTWASPRPEPPQQAPVTAPGGDSGPAPGPQLRAWMAGDPPPAEPPALWVGALAEEIERTGAAPLSLLLIELEDAGRVLAVESEPDATFSEFTHALRRAVRRQDMLVCETVSRAWVIARDTDRDSARSLAERISASVREARPWRGAPLLASVGFAVLGQDSSTSAELIEAAEEARFAAAAGGTL
jgi:GGDEF domain-containing protein